MRLRARARSAAGRKARKSFWKNKTRSQSAVGEVVGRRGCDCSLRGRTGAAQRIGPGVVTEYILMPVNAGQLGEAVAVVGCSSNRRFENLADFRVFLQGEAFLVTEGAQHSLMRGKASSLLPRSDSLMLRSSAPYLIRDRRNNPRNQVVLKFKNRSPG